MKRYVKPELYYEHFELSQTIADCAWEVRNSQSSLTCTAEGDPKYGIGGRTLFTEAPRCDTYEYCYMAATDGLRTFKS